jgi:hypothetical protein
MRRSVLALGLLLFPIAAFAADPMPKPELYSLHEEVVQPSMMARYEAATKDLIAALAAKNVVASSFNFRTAMTTDFHYIYLTPINSFADLDTMMHAWMTVGDTIGRDKWSDIEKRNEAAMTSYNDIVVMRRPDLSYSPANPRVPMDQARWTRLQFYYLMPGHEGDAEAVARDYAALFKAKNISDSYSIYFGVMGEDLPLLVAALPAKSAADFAANDDRINATLGADVLALQARAMAITRRFETRDLILRPDLSYPPPAPPAK